MVYVFSTLRPETVTGTARVRKQEEFEPVPLSAYDDVVDDELHQQRGRHLDGRQGDGYAKSDRETALVGADERQELLQIPGFRLAGFVH